MEFDAAVRFPGCRRWEWEQSDECISLETLFEKINRAYEAQGYQMPRLVFWNLCSRTNTVPLQQMKLESPWSADLVLPFIRWYFPMNWIRIDACWNS